MAKLLLVEDNEMNRDMLARRLMRRGFEVTVAIDGEQALKKLSEGRFDLVLMDLSLPVMDGWEATRRIRQKPKYADLPIIALTAHALEGDRHKAIEAGCNGFETKPVKIESLLETMSNWLDG
ncbi:response regulator [Persicimonas caeni]|uniref:Response regulator n=1 Tax=Persicimonas caeni TaxID=2292766 RepID=A0A4Y6PQY0_PERCE|nr:response regulator [Persicimonas caeni]QDG50731.1 response regulator [Persicimonas caeni]QED31952.1 response regulator [Persicimonas caeni]